jgi:hypothetical protein
MYTTCDIYSDTGSGQDERLQHVVWDLHNRFMASPGEAYKRTLDTLATEMMNEV